MRNRTSKPPKIADQLLGLLCKTELVDEILGDLHEYFEELEEYSKAKRQVLYWFHVLHFLRPNLTKKFYGTKRLNQYGMLKLTFKTASRTLFKEKLTSSMSLLSLVFGALCFHLIYLWINNEVNTNKFHKNLEHIHFATFKSNPDADFSPMVLTDFFDLNFDEFPHIKASAAVHVYRKNEIKLVTEKVEFPARAFVADSTFFEIFDFKLLVGNVEGALSNPTEIILTQEFARSVFGSANPIGQIVNIQCDNKGTYQVGGIMEDIPSTSSMEFDFIIPRHSEHRWRRLPMEIILTDSFFDLEDFNGQIAKIAQVNPRFPESTLAFFPFESLYLDKPFLFNLFHKYGNSDSIVTMSFIALMILLITMLSFVGLQTTSQLSLNKKTGIKQVIGASKNSLFLEVLVGRLIYLFLATSIAFLLFELVFPLYSSAMEIQIDRNISLDIFTLFSVVALIVGISTIIGLLHILRINTIDALRNQLTFLKVPRMQRVLTTIQYLITIVLLVVTSVVFTQYSFMLQKDTGLLTENIISVDFFDMISGNGASEERQQTLMRRKYVMNKMLENPNIVSISQGSMPVGASIDQGSWKTIGHSYDYTSQNKVSVDPFYADMLGIEVIAGRFFSDSLDELLPHKAVINEAALKYWNIEDISQAKLANSMWGGEEDPFDIIGVVKDYHYEHLSNTIEPLILLYRSYEDYSFLVKSRPGKEREVLAHLGELYEEINPKGIFQHEMLKDNVDAQYQKEKRVGKTYFAFTLVALLLSSLGLFTFALHETKRRTKEIGIRKINGANTADIVSLFSISFLKSILIAFVIACPVAWVLMSSWLENFAYRTELSWWMFFSAGVLSIIVAMIAVSWQTLTVARRNPVESLRYE